MLEASHLAAQLVEMQATNSGQPPAVSAPVVEGAKRLPPADASQPLPASPPGASRKRRSTAAVVTAAPATPAQQPAGPDRAAAGDTPPCVPENSGTGGDSRQILARLSDIMAMLVKQDRAAAQRGEAAAQLARHQRSHQTASAAAPRSSHAVHHAVERAGCVSTSGSRPGHRPADRSKLSPAMRRRRVDAMAERQCKSVAHHTASVRLPSRRSLPAWDDSLPRQPPGPRTPLCVSNVSMAAPPRPSSMRSANGAHHSHAVRRDPRLHRQRQSRAPSPRAPSGHAMRPQDERHDDFVCPTCAAALALRR